MAAKNKASSGIGLEIARILLQYEAEKIRKDKQQQAGQDRPDACTQTNQQPSQQPGQEGKEDAHSN